MQQLIGMQEERKKLQAAMKNRIPALLIGETGTGKTSLAQEAARELGLECVRVNLNGGTTPDQVIGRYQVKAENGAPVTYFQEGVIPRAMKAGAVLILDELNAALPDTLFCLHALLEEKPRLFIPETQEDITPAERFTVIATMNPSHDYAGTKGLNAALYSRFGCVVRFKKLRGGDFLQALGQHVPGITAGKAERICSIIEECDRLRDEEKITTRLTLREAIAAGRFAMDGLTLREAITAAMLDKLEGYERELVTSGFAEDKGSAGETIEEVFAAALETAKAREEADALREELSGLREELSGLRELQQLMGVLAAKAGTKTKRAAVEAPADGTLVFNPDDVKPWGPIKKKGAR